MLYTLNRFEDNELAVLESEDGLGITVPKAWLPTTKEGDVLNIETSLELAELEPGPLNAVYLEIEDTAANERLERRRSLRALLPEGPEGNLTL